MRTNAASLAVALACLTSLAHGLEPDISPPDIEGSRASAREQLATILAERETAAEGLAGLRRRRSQFQGERDALREEARQATHGGTIPVLTMESRTSSASNFRLPPDLYVEGILAGVMAEDLRTAPDGRQRTPDEQRELRNQIIYRATLQYLGVRNVYSRWNRRQAQQWDAMVAVMDEAIRRQEAEVARQNATAAAAIAEALSVPYGVMNVFMEGEGRGTSGTTALAPAVPARPTTPPPATKAPPPSGPGTPAPTPPVQPPAAASPTWKLWTPTSAQLAQGAPRSWVCARDFSRQGWNCGIAVGVKAEGFPPNQLYRVRIDITEWTTFRVSDPGQPRGGTQRGPTCWYAIKQRPNMYDDRNFSFVLPMPDGPFAFTLSIPDLPSVPPITVRGIKARATADDPGYKDILRDGRCPSTDGDFRFLLDDAKQFTARLGGVRDPKEVVRCHERLREDYRKLATGFSRLSRYEEALKCATAALKHHQGAAPGHAPTEAVWHRDGRAEILMEMANAAYGMADAGAFASAAEALAGLLRADAENSRRRGGQSDIMFGQARSAYWAYAQGILVLTGDLARARRIISEGAEPCHREWAQARARETGGPTEFQPPSWATGP